MFDDRSPIYRQIAERIKADVLSGALKADEQVMSTNQYAAYYRINPATAAKAFQQTRASSCKTSYNAKNRPKGKKLVSICNSYWLPPITSMT